jgi:hypothetical protein
MGSSRSGDPFRRTDANPFRNSKVTAYYGLRDIWQEVRRALGLDDAAAARLRELEVQIEHEEAIPVTENLAQVRDGDLLVSDTYLPAEVVLSLLRRAGLERAVALVVSNDGKFRGRVWPQLLAKVAIGQHFGDNPHSDGKTPSEAGGGLIKTLVRAICSDGPLLSLYPNHQAADEAYLKRVLG